MKKINTFIHGVALLAMGLSLSLQPAAAADKTALGNAQVVKSAMTDLFVKRDVGAIARYWGTPYLQHNPGIPDGHDGLGDIVKNLPAEFKYEPGAVTATGDIVMIHGRYTGWGPKPLVVVDMFRVKYGKLVEHWDVVQEEVPTAQTKSGRPMFDGF